MEMKKMHSQTTALARASFTSPNLKLTMGLGNLYLKIDRAVAVAFSFFNFNRVPGSMFNIRIAFDISSLLLKTTLSCSIPCKISLKTFSTLDICSGHAK